MSLVRNYCCSAIAAAANSGTKVNAIREKNDMDITYLALLLTLVLLLGGCIVLISAIERRRSAL
jgi:hypothetical protein